MRAKALLVIPLILLLVYLAIVLIADSAWALLARRRLIRAEDFLPDEL